MAARNKHCLLDNNIETPPCPPGPDEVFHECNGRGQGCLSSPAQSWSGAVCPWTGQCAVSCLPLIQEGGCHFTSWADNLHMNMMGGTLAGGRRGNPASCLACWSARTGLLKQWEPMELQYHWKPDMNFFINQWNNVQHRYGAWCSVWVGVSPLVLLWSTLLSEKQQLFQCSQVYSCFPVALSWLIFESEYGLKDNSPLSFAQRKDKWLSQVSYLLEISHEWHNHPP